MTAERKIHWWHRFFYGPRLFHMTMTGVVALLLHHEGHLSGERAWAVAITLGIWAHVARWVTPLFAPSKRGALMTFVVDLFWLGFFVPVVGWSWPLVAPSMVAITQNSLATRGWKLMVGSFALFALVSGACQLWLPFASPELVSAGLLSGALAVLQTMIYTGILAARDHEITIQIHQQRRELQELREQLEDKVIERTKALASTNEAISRFVPKEFLQSLGHEDVRSAQLGDATSRNLTVLFADIRNFTTLSEQMSPEETFQYLNDCLSRVGPHIRKRSGFIDKYIGDAIMALFPDSPEAAVQAAVSMLEEVEAQNQRHPDKPPLALGIGIHFGWVMMGTIGEEERFEATVISDAVNLTARLESLTKRLGCTLLLSEEAAEHLDGSWSDHTRSLGQFVVKGKARPVSLVEVFAGDAAELRDHKRATESRLKAGIEAYAAHRYAEAIAIFEQLVEAHASDGPAQWWLEHVRYNEKHRIDPGEDGAIQLDAK